MCYRSGVLVGCLINLMIAKVRDKCGFRRYKNMDDSVAVNVIIKERFVSFFVIVVHWISGVGLP